jgi:hypothetical protein
MIPLHEKEVGVAHSPARLYIFSRKEYNKFKNENSGD